MRTLHRCRLRRGGLSEPNQRFPSPQVQASLLQRSGLQIFGAAFLRNFRFLDVSFRFHSWSLPENREAHFKNANECSSEPILIKLLSHRQASGSESSSLHFTLSLPAVDLALVQHFAMQGNSLKFLPERSPPCLRNFKFQVFAGSFRKAPELRDFLFRQRIRR